MQKERHNTAKLILYIRQGCPFCRKVLNTLTENNISIPTKDISSDPAIRAELVQIGEKSQVPCLIINGQPLYESDDIIDWLKNNSNKN